MAGEGDGPEESDAPVDRRGHWQEPPQAWERPEAALGQKQFLAALEACLKALPERTARVFLMREHLGLETSAICKELRITPTPCRVMLHRARLAICTGCRTAGDQLRFLRAAMQELSRNGREDPSG